MTTFKLIAWKVAWRIAPWVPFPWGARFTLWLIAIGLRPMIHELKRCAQLLDESGEVFRKLAEDAP